MAVREDHRNDPEVLANQKSKGNRMLQKLKAAVPPAGIFE